MTEINKKELLKRALIVNESFEGIISYHEVFYIHSVLYSAERSLAAFDRYKNLLSQKNEDATLLISTVQEAIGHAGALSRYFWTSGFLGYKYPKEFSTLKKNRAKKLRNQFGLTDNSPLKERSLRNAWEHFDERLDMFLITNDIGYFFPTPMLDKHTLADEPEGRIFKLLDIKAHCLVLLGEKFFFKPIKDEVLKIYNYAIKSDKNGGRL